MTCSCSIFSCNCPTVLFPLYAICKILIHLKFTTLLENHLSYMNMGMTMDENSGCGHYRDRPWKTVYTSVLIIVADDPEKRYVAVHCDLGPIYFLYTCRYRYVLACTNWYQPVFWTVGMSVWVMGLDISMTNPIQKRFCKSG